MSGTTIMAQADRRLVPDYGGLIEVIAIALPPVQFETAGSSFLTALHNLASTFPATITLVAVTEPGHETEVAEWGADLACTLDIAATAAVGSMHGEDIWAQDPLHVYATSGAAVYQAAIGDRAGGHATWLARRAGNTPALAAPRVYLNGGNMLVGETFRLVGSDVITWSHPPQKPACTTVAGLDARPVHYYGYRDSDYAMRSISWFTASVGRIRDRMLVPPPGSGREALLRGFLALATEILAKILKLDPVLQDPFHLDLMATLTGTAEGEAPVIFIGQPEDASDSNDAPNYNMTLHRQMLQATADRLARRGFAVKRNPVPFRRVPGGQYAIRAYNNSIVENRIREGESKPKVWMPIFGDAEPMLRKYDDANAIMWEDLGFEVVRVAGWGPVADQSGCLRCATKVLKRGL